MGRAETAMPVRMRRVALVAPEQTLRASLVRIAEAGCVQIDLAEEGGTDTRGPAARRLQRLRVESAARPVLSETPPDLDALERALLHRCRVKLPWDKARERLGYVPIVSFAEGCRRSVAWLEFADYPVVTTPGPDDRRAFLDPAADKIAAQAVSASSAAIRRS